jgi:hypothetical protein
VYAFFYHLASESGVRVSGTVYPGKHITSCKKKDASGEKEEKLRKL